MDNSPETEVGLQKIAALMRTTGFCILLLHFYDVGYPYAEHYRLSNSIIVHLMKWLLGTGLLAGYRPHCWAFGLMCLSAVGATGRKEECISRWKIMVGLIVGTLLFFGSSLLSIYLMTGFAQLVIYVLISLLGYLVVLRNMARLSRLIQIRLGEDIFNDLNETFPQEERRLENEFSINLPTTYHLKSKIRSGWINIINPFRGLLVMGSPGSGKSYFVIQHVIRQHLSKNFTMLVYDFKYPDLSKIAFGALNHHYSAGRQKPAFYQICLDNPTLSNRCNPLDPDTMVDITDATESSRSVLLGLNKEWITKQGDFFVESPINFVTAIIWFLKKYQSGEFCTLPHVIEMMQVDYEKLFPVLKTEPEIEVLISPFVSAYQHDAMEQLEGQVANAKIGMARLSSPQLYWILSGSEFTLDINNPQAPKIICLGNNPQKQQTFGPILSLYVNRLIKLVNQPGKRKCSLVFDEFPTIFLNGMDNLIATARSNQVATCLGLQDFSQLKKDYGHDQASVILNIAGNVLSGQVMGDTARMLSERFGRIMQVKESISINPKNTSTNKSTQMDFAIPQSKIASLSSGEFVGMVADNPNQRIKLKMFHGEILNDKMEQDIDSSKQQSFPERPIITKEMIEANYRNIKQDIVELIEKEIQQLTAVANIKART